MNVFLSPLCADAGNCFWMTVLRVPSLTVVTTAAHDTFQSCFEATRALTNLLIVLFQPCLRLCYLTTYWIVWVLWQTIGLYVYKHGWTHVRDVGLAVLHFQQSLSHKQIAMEMGLVVIVIILYKLSKWIQPFVTAVKIRCDRWQRNVTKSYRRVHRRVSHTSHILGVMLPHILFSMAILLIRSLIPSLWKHLAVSSHLRSLLLVWMPWFQTLVLLYYTDQPIYNTSNDENARNNNHNTNTTQTPKPRTTTLRRQLPTPHVQPTHDVFSPVRSIIHNPTQQSRDMMDYWTIYAAMQLALTLLTTIPLLRHVASTTIFWEVQLAIAIWLYTLPLVEEHGLIHDMALHIRAAARQVQHHSASLVSLETWQTYILPLPLLVLQTAVAARLVKQQRAATIQQVLVEVRTLLLPALLTGVPFLSAYAIAYVKFVVPLSRDSDNYLQYWLLHVLVTIPLGAVTRVLWWLPFGSLWVCFLWWLLSFPAMVRLGYHALVHELQHVGLWHLSGQQQQEGRESRLAKAFAWVWRHVPRAADANTGEGAPEGSTATREEAQDEVATLPTTPTRIRATVADPEDDDLVMLDDESEQSVVEPTRSETARVY